MTCAYDWCRLGKIFKWWTQIPELLGLFTHLGILHNTGYTINYVRSCAEDKN
jgi:hypothetical protein